MDGGAELRSNMDCWERRCRFGLGLSSSCIFKKGAGMTELTKELKFYSKQAQRTGSDHLSSLLCPDPHCTHYLGENAAHLLQARE